LKAIELRTEWSKPSQNWISGSTGLNRIEDALLQSAKRSLRKVTPTLLFFIQATAPNFERELKRGLRVENLGTIEGNSAFSVITLGKSTRVSNSDTRAGSTPPFFYGVQMYRGTMERYTVGLFSLNGADSRSRKKLRRWVARKRGVEEFNSKRELYEINKDRERMGERQIPPFLWVRPGKDYAENSWFPPESLSGGLLYHIQDTILTDFSTTFWSS